MMKKQLCKYRKHLLTSILNILLPKVFCLFHYAIEIKKDLFLPYEFDNDYWAI